MNKHYDKYLCRADSTKVRYYKIVPMKIDPPQKKLIKQDVDFKAIFDRGQMDCIKLGFEFYGWVFSIIFVIGVLLLGASLYK